MDLTEFDYDLPKERIAQEPLMQRDRSKLLVLDRRSHRRYHHTFSDLPDLLQGGDLVVLNDTKVIPARLHVRSERGALFELFFLEHQKRHGRCLIQPSRRVKRGTTLQLPNLEKLLVTEEIGDGKWGIELESEETIEEVLNRYGEVPLPPYIDRPEGPDASDRERYQTVYAKKRGAVAAPTAGLHFTPTLLERLKERGISLAYITLHVGLGTFLPLRHNTIEANRLEGERFEIEEETANIIHKTKLSGGRIIAIGTTVTRTLESQAIDATEVKAGSGETELFITPGFRFKIVDSMVTNFHLPRSSLLLLVSAFAGRDLILQSYQEAIEKGYRFYSYGDAMLIL